MLYPFVTKNDQNCFRIINNDACFSKLQQDSVSLTTWSLSNELHSKPTRCSNLRISRKRISPYRSYGINGRDVEVVSTERHLGVVIVNDTLEGPYTHDKLLKKIDYSALLEGATQELLAVLPCCVFTVP